MRVQATHYICIKERLGREKLGKGEDGKEILGEEVLGKDLLVMRSGDKKGLTKKEEALLEKEASGKFKVIEGDDSGSN